MVAALFLCQGTLSLALRRSIPSVAPMHLRTVTQRFSTSATSCPFAAAAANGAAKSASAVNAPCTTTSAATASAAFSTAAADSKPVTPASASSSPSPAPPAAPEVPLIFSPNCHLPVPLDLPEYEWAEVHRHNRLESFWIVIDGYVYDMTKYQRFHPGGGIDSLFAAGHGTDRREQFNEFHSFNERRLTRKFVIGKIKEGSFNKKEVKQETNGEPTATPTPAAA